MAEPSEPSFSYESINRGDVSPLKYVSIRFMIKSFDFQDSSQTSMMEHLEYFHLRLRGIRYLTSIKQYSKDSRFVYPDFSCPRGLLNSSS